MAGVSRSISTGGEAAGTKVVLGSELGATTIGAELTVAEVEEVGLWEVLLGCCNSLSS